MLDCLPSHWLCFLGLAVECSFIDVVRCSQERVGSALDRLPPNARLLKRRQQTDKLALLECALIGAEELFSVAPRPCGLDDEPSGIHMIQYAHSLDVLGAGDLSQVGN